MNLPSYPVRAFAAATMFAVFCAGPAFASADDDAAKCQGTIANPSPDLTIEGCTNLLKLEQIRSDNRAIVFFNRGNAYFDKTNYASAIGDYDQAIAFKADYAGAYQNRGIAKKHIGDIAGGDADMAKAKTLK